MIFVCEFIQLGKLQVFDNRGEKGRGEIGGVVECVPSHLECTPQLC
jgi:hypothetical protein